MKETLAKILSWIAFFQAAMVLNIPAFIIFCSKCDMFEDKSLYYLVVNAHLDFLGTLPGGAGLWLLGLSPTIWLLLWTATGQPRFLPWK